MDNLIANSVEILKKDNNLQIAYGWMDLGDLICEKLRFSVTLTQREIMLVDEITTLLKQNKLDDNITLYRGMTKEFDTIIAEKQFNAMSPYLNTAKTYGPHLIEIIVPKGSNAFYISAWELINTTVGEQEEKEVLLLPGKFTLYRETDNLTTYIYNNL